MRSSMQSKCHPKKTFLFTSTLADQVVFKCFYAKILSGISRQMT